MYSPTTTYSRGDIVIEVRAGESHSAAWTAVLSGVPLAPAGRSSARGVARPRCEHRRPRTRTARRRGRTRQPA